MSRNSTELADQAIERGHALEDAGHFASALDCYLEALRCSPEYPRAHLNAGNALRLLRRYADAEAAFREAIRRDPEYAEAHFNLSMLLAIDERRVEARMALQHVLELQPAMIDKVLDAESYLLFSSAFREDADPDVVAREHFRVGALIARAAGPPYSSWSNVPDPDRKLRIGYVSGDFAPHPVALFLRPMIEQRDRQQFDLYCYSNSDDNNPIAAKIRQQIDGWRPIAGASDADVAERIRSDGIDVLVDLSGHTERNRLGVFARHPAPIQVTWLGYLNTTGLPTVAYRVCDSHTDPPGETETFHAERLFRMPHSQWCYRPWDGISPSAASDDARGDRIVFGSLNQSIKISEPCVDLWSRVLLRAPKARLLILDIRDAHVGAAIADALSRRGVGRDRIELHPRRSMTDYYAAIGAIDIALDTYPHNGATTTFDALWTGVPVVALRGKRGISRSSYSIMRTLGMTELIADSPQDYVDINVRLAFDATWRKEMRLMLPERLRTSPLMDARRFARDLEAGYRRMWRSWCEVQSGRA